MAAMVGGLAVLTGLVGAAFHAANAAGGRSMQPSFWLMALAAAMAYGSASLVLRLSGAVGLRYLLGGIGLVQGVGLLAAELALLSPDVALGEWVMWLGSWLWAPAYVTIAAVLPLLLPTGRLLSPRWRPAMVLSTMAVAVTTLGWALTPYELQDFPDSMTGATNPVGTEAVLAPPFPAVSVAVLLAAVGVALASLVIRWRRAVEVERQQLKWVLLGFVMTVLLFAVGPFLPAEVVGLSAALAMLPLPLAIGVAVLRHGLWEVDVVISRGLLYGVLSAAVGAVYVVAVRLLGDPLGATTGAPILATTVIALLVLPMHSRLQRWVNRLVHGDVDEPYAVLARLGDRLAAAAEPTDLAERVLPSVVEQVARVLRADRASLALRDGSVTSHGRSGRERAVELPLDYAGEPLGTLSVWRPGGFGWGEQRVLRQLARQAAVAAHTVLLFRDAQHARESVVLAREEERRQLRRDLHDGVGPSLAALALHVETARDLAADDPAAATALLDRLVPRLNATVADVRALVHELRPPTLDELGLAAAVRELGARLSTASTVVRTSADDLGELPAAVEVAAYRIAGEAVTNAVRHAGASRVEVRLMNGGSQLRLEVVDDGSGVAVAAPAGVGVSSMRARAEELGGHLSIDSGPDGTRLTAVLPSEAP